ncbi:MAG: discoidin domain-containing protein [Pirellulaceae bacterium]
MKLFGCTRLPFTFVMGVSVCAASWAADAPTNKPVATVTREMIEADWLRQDEVRNLGSWAEPISPQEDAAGGCDGLKDGGWGFHTDRQQDPWWQVDLERVWPLDQIFVYNRCDGSSERAVRLKLLLSIDGETWSECYQHDGTMFLGAPDNQPLTIYLKGTKARFVRVQTPGNDPLHLDEIEVFVTSNHRNVALGKPASQSSVSRWSTRNGAPRAKPTRLSVTDVIRRGRRLADSLRDLGADVDEGSGELDKVEQEWASAKPDASIESRRALYLKARWIVRKLAFSNPRLDFDRLLFVKRVPTSFTHMSDQYYGWFSRPGGGLYLLEGLQSDHPSVRPITGRQGRKPDTGDLPPGNIIRPDISYDGTKILFAYCQYFPGLAETENKLDKTKIDEDAFYHLYEINVDGSGLRRLTRGKYDHFDGRYLPSGDIVFLSTRKGQFLQCGKTSATSSYAGDLPDSYVRCGGGPERPVAIYTLHVMSADGQNLRAISAFESFEWTPSVADDGRVIYARWDYVDRDAMPYMSLCSTLPDGTNSHAVYGNYTVNPYAIFEARSVPHSQKLVFTASAHHATTGGSLVMLDPSVGSDGSRPLTRLTPEVPFPEIEAWPETYYANPFPLSEQHYLVAWSDQPLATGWPRVNSANAMGLYLYDAFGNLELIYRDPDISSMYPIPVRSRPRPPVIGGLAQWERPEDGRMLLLDVYRGLYDLEPPSVTALRIVGLPPKTQPTMDSPKLGLTRHDPGKFVLGTVPVEKDGSAYFQVPSGLPFFLQALDADGMALQSMRSATYVQPGQTFTCAGCHEPRNTAPSNFLPLAAQREPSRIQPGPAGSWPLDFATLVQPVLDQHCIRCHQPGRDGAPTDLTPAKAYETLTTYGERSLRTHVRTRHRQGRSTAGACGARTSPLLKLIQAGHYEVSLEADDLDRLITWMDTYSQQTGSFGEDQQKRLRQLRQRMAHLLN